ncbi:hypothetical protein Tco_0482363 [Tanacetum coccineum]
MEALSTQKLKAGDINVLMELGRNYAKWLLAHQDYELILLAGYSLLCLGTAVPDPRTEESYLSDVQGFPSLEKVDLCISYPQKTNVHRIFQRLHSVKSLALSLEIVELLSTSEKNYRLKTSLEILKTQPDEEQETMKIKLSAQVTNYLLGTSSNATFTMISHDEARTIKITTVAYRLMAALWEILEETEAKMANMEWKKTLADS